MEKKIKMVCFDMDGTIADFYATPNWKEMLQQEMTLPYEIAKPMWDMMALRNVLVMLQEKGIEVRVITWLSMDASTDFRSNIRQAKREWLAHYDFPFNNFHGVRYGATKADSVRKYLEQDECAILFDDNAQVRQGWHLGEAIDPTEVNIIEILKNLL